MSNKFKLLLSCIFMLNIVLPVFSFSPSGGVLVLDGEDDYAILPFGKYGYIIPRDTDAFTVEFWFKPTSDNQPAAGKSNIVLSQQVRFALSTKNRCVDPVNETDELCILGAAYLEGAAHGISGVYAVIKKNEWNYMAVIFTDSTLYLAYNNKIYKKSKRTHLNVVAGELRLPEGFKNFCVGGYAEDFQIPKLYFHGEIDTIRISDIARYDLPIEKGISAFEPPHRFSSDANTLALWNFDEHEGSETFEDASGNGYTLTGMNGATTSGTLSVQPTSNSLSTTWGKIKSE